MTAVRSKAELQIQKSKLANSYNELLEQFSSKELGTVGNYTLGKLIGKGSFGKVYLATHKLTNGSKVVLKSANKGDSNLAREIHHHRQFLHPHIARLYEVIITENLVWLVLEYCSGDELYNYLLRNGALPPDKVQNIFTQLVGAVAYVHSMSCVHRDLKLENILLDKNENVKLCDFGFTREYEGKTNHLQTFCGTVCYSAPEMLKGEKYAGEKVDVWSLGIILYALLTGQLPFDEDDELETKHKILSAEPNYPSSLPPDAKILIYQMLSKRPLHRPSLAEILAHPFLAAYAPAQQAILKIARPVPFASTLEKETLQRMRSAGVDIDKVIENVIAQRCDSLAGWWALLVEKEERKELRRERKRKEREMETKSLRRVSGASSRMERMVPSLLEVDEDGQFPIPDVARSRGRRERRSIPIPQLIVPDLPRLPELGVVDSPTSATPPPPIEKDPVRSFSSSRSRPPPPPKEWRRSRSSTLQLVSGNPELLPPPNGIMKRRPSRRQRHSIMHQLAALKHWFLESAKRAKSPGMKLEPPAIKVPTAKSSPGEARRPSLNVQTHLTEPTIPTSTQPRTPHTPRQRVSSNHRSSLSPAPMTPRSANYRRSSGVLRGRKSTSSSVSSVRSIHHVHTHSKTSSTSSNTNSISSSAANLKSSSHGRSPHTSLKVLPATPISSTFPSNIRVVRTTPSLLTNKPFDETSFGAMASPGLTFARRKKTPFRGPMLHINPRVASGSPAGRSRDGGHRRSESMPRRVSAEIIDIVEEEDEDVEEVDAFSPVLAPDVEERIVEEGEGKPWG